MKKICYVVTVPLTIRAFFISQLKYLSEHGFDVTVVCEDDGKIGNELGNKIRFYGIEIPRGVSFGGSFKAISQLKSFFENEKFDIIQYSTPNAALYASIAAKKAKCKVRNYHLMGYRYLGSKGFGKLFLKTIEKVTCTCSTSIECVSSSNLFFGIKEKVFKKDKAVVVWNGSSGGVNLKRFDIKNRSIWRDELRSKLGYTKNDFVFGFVGRITKDKGINELIESFFNLNDDSRLLIIGINENDGTVDFDLWKNANNSARVTIHSSSSEIEKYYAAIDILVLPSYREGFGNVIIEAAAMGTPSIVSDIPGPIDAIINGKTGIAVRSKSVDDLTEAMIVAKSLDLNRMGNDAVEFVRSSFDSELLCEKILERKNLLLNGICQS